MKYFALVLTISISLFTGCSNSKEPEALIVSKENIGKEVAIEGWAIDRKGGAVVMNNTTEVWIDNLSSWPEGYYLGKDKGKKIKATGILAEDNNLPVFVRKENGEISQGIEVEAEADLKEASHRFILKNPKWETYD